MAFPMATHCSMIFKSKVEDDQFSKHAMNLVRNLNIQRLNARFCDVVIHVGEKTFMAQRNVLASFSQYFRTMFTSNMLESHERHIHISGVTEDAMDIIIQFVYTSKILLDVDNVEMVLAAASMFLMDEVFKKCIEFLQAHLTFANCLEVLALADLYSCASLKESAIELGRRQFKDVASTPDFLQISVYLLLDFVSSDNLHVNSEKEVYEAVMTWVKHSEPARKQHLPQLLRQVRLQLLDVDYLAKNVRPVFEGNVRCCALVDAAVNHAGPRANVRKQWDVLFAVSNSRCSMKQGWNITPFGSWTVGQNLPEPLLVVLSVAVLDQVVYVVGVRKNTTVGLYAYCLVDKTWSRRCPAPDCVPYDEDYTVAAYGDHLYMYGSTRDKRLRVFMRFDPSKNAWQELRPLDVGLSPVLLAMDGHLYAVSGNRDLSDYSNAGFVYRYHSDVNEWEKMPWQVLRRVFHSVAQFQGQVYVVGGEQVAPPRASGLTSVVERYDPVNDEWRNIAELPEQRHNASLVVCGRQLYVTGGFIKEPTGGDERHPVTTVQMYDAARRDWVGRKQAVKPFGKALAADEEEGDVRIVSLSQQAVHDSYKKAKVGDNEAEIDEGVGPWNKDCEVRLELMKPVKHDLKRCISSDDDSSGDDV